MKFYKREIKELLIADIALSIAFTNLIYGSPGFSNILYTFFVSFLAVTLGFALHEIAHKLTAQHFGAISFFRASMFGLIFSILSSFFGFLIAIPGATVVASWLSRKEEGIVSIAGPAWNVFIGLVCVLLAIYFPNFERTFAFVGFVNLWLAFFNMLPMPPLDGSKVLRWNKAVYFLFMSIIVILLLYFEIVSLASLLFAILFAILFYFFFTL
jgi:Zn-dependent protease